MLKETNPNYLVLTELFMQIIDYLYCDKNLIMLQKTCWLQKAIYCKSQEAYIIVNNYLNNFEFIAVLDIAVEAQNPILGCTTLLENNNRIRDYYDWVRGK